MSGTHSTEFSPRVGPAMKKPNDSRSHGFGPVALPNARVLILGSLPGQVSLARGEYYAHSRNAFWTIMGNLVGASRDMPYAARLQRMQERGIALWDVCASAYRPGSLDSSLSADIPNDFTPLLARCGELNLIAFNGAKAAKLFHQRIVSKLPPSLAGGRRSIRHRKGAAPRDRSMAER